MLTDQSARSMNFLPAVRSLWQNTTGDGVAASSSLLSRKKSQADETRTKGKEKKYVWCDMWVGIGIGVRLGLGHLGIYSC